MEIYSVGIPAENTYYSGTTGNDFFILKDNITEDEARSFMNKFNQKLNELYGRFYGGRENFTDGEIDRAYQEVFNNKIVTDQLRKVLNPTDTTDGRLAVILKNGKIFDPDSEPEYLEF